MKKEKNKTKVEKFINFVDKNRKCIYSFVGGVLVTAIVATIIWPDRIATLKDGTQPIAEINGENITADSYYEELKAQGTISLFLDIIDNAILSKKYEMTKEMEQEVEDAANNYYSQYEQYYQMDKEQVLTQLGFKTHEDFIDTLTINYLRNKYFEEYTEKLVTEKEINDYYENDVYGDINSKHMLVEINDDMTDENALNLANEIIDKLNSGKTFDEVKEEYSDKITYEELGYQGFNSNIQDSYMNALKNISNDTYTTEPVKTTYGYHVIYRIDQKEKPSLDDIKDEVIDALADKKASEDSNLYYKSLIQMREDNNLKFSDTVIENEYNDYTKQYK